MDLWSCCCGKAVNESEGVEGAELWEADDDRRECGGRGDWAGDWDGWAWRGWRRG